MKVRELIGAGLAGLCAAPSAVCNVLPHAGLALSGNAASIGLATFQGVSVLAMGGMPFAMKKVSGVMAKAGLALLSAWLFWLSFLNAIDLASHAREEATGVARGTLAKAAGLNSRIADLEKSRRQVPSFTFTSPAMVGAAQETLRAAEAAREAECKKVGDKCRQRQDEASAAALKLGEAAGQRELTEKAESFDTQIADAKAGLLNLGPIPEHADATAAKIARMLSLVMTADASTDEAISEWRPIWFAVGIELLAFLGPLGMLAAFGSGHVSEEQHRKAALSETPALESMATAKAPATPTPRTKPRAIKAKTVAGAGDVRDFFNSRTIARPGHEIRCHEVYAAYRAWCTEQGLEAVSLTRFGTAAKGEAGVEYVERSRRGYYRGLALKGAALKVVSA